MSRDPHMVENIARVVGFDDEGAWLEPEQTTSCGHCASADACGSKGIGSVASRLEERRFRIYRAPSLIVGDRVVVGIDDRALIKGALIAYAVPLLAAFIVGGLVQSVANDDTVTMLSMPFGLAAGLLLARIAARRMSRNGSLSPRYLRHIGGSERCDATICEATRSAESPAPAVLRRQPQVTQ